MPDEIPSPEFDIGKAEGGQYDSSFLPGTYDQAWLLKLIEVSQLPVEIKVPLVKLLLDTAAKTNIERSEIPMHLLHIEEIFRGYRIFVNSGKLDPKLKTMEDMILHEFELMLCRSVKGWQGELIFTRRYDVRQTARQEKAKRFFGMFKNKNAEEVEE